MKAAVVERYGPPEVVEVREVPDPPVRGKGRVLVRVRAAAVTSADGRIRGARFPRGFGTFARLAFGVRRPRRAVLGGVFSGVVEEVGPGVSGIAVGDEVCGMTGVRFGTHAELVVARADRLVVKPAGVSHQDAAGVLFGGTTALHYLRDRVRPGHRVLVNGASGAIGTSAVQLARLAGGRVTGVCSGANADLVRSLGAEEVVDHTTTPLASLPGSYDVVLDTVGNIDIAGGRALLAPGGVLLLAVADLGQTLRARGDVVAGPSPEKPEYFARLLDLVASGDLRVVVSRTMPLDDVAEAHRVVDTGRKVGNVVVTP
ncbi:alcohol dehydrogenase [Nocardioides sp. Root122]|uniref:NAD(P)-dependent alcohol dehydrogenase n=1 Tax=Nocardioides TaxID=1839 RepID=UPI000703918B|nr:MULTISPECIES: NAD(P)-dependent alcohol dehydrogenase [Nocardioides]KQV64976.1 alcohol dehydrogenase [Nocardioides sp. Root122]MCK9823462.1 NAD(P)-dependent alcohol dehydrogenase [Nocardioides cavernae]